ncbi:MAG: 16S rRNA (guanine(966)-N(2))-methyltransferase RsmD [Alphaproteobacteria bacterium]|nr:16S rRNA (guanine(966)-N(2))-methyltransferase RsmD [Alphaproteobacteria bacterium]
MRITSGEYGGRKLSEPKGNAIRPTSDKVRQAIFNMLGARMDIEGATIIDLFCGTGALSFEALSRGADHAILCDLSATSLKLAKENASHLGAMERCTFIKTDASKGFEKKPGQDPANLVFCDPPYDKGLSAKALKALHEKGWLADGCIIVAESEKNLDYTLSEFKIQTEKNYGDTKIVLLEYIL